MTLHFDADACIADPVARRRAASRRAHLAGQAAEACVERDYAARGMRPVARRWRGGGGEIDLILRDGGGLVFVEVKAARDFDRAAESLSAAQMRRICTAASVYAAQDRGGQLCGMRFDVALVNGRGDTRIIENAFGDF
jgi:putative endonuclease